MIYNNTPMCYNCGCEEPNDPMGKPVVHGASLTDSSFEEMAKEWNMTKKQAQENVLRLLQKQVGQNKN